MSATQLERLTPQLQSSVKHLTATGRASLSADLEDSAIQQFQVCARQWDDQVEQLSSAIDSLVEPWATPALQVAAAAKIGKLSHLEAQVSIGCVEHEAQVRYGLIVLKEYQIKSC